MPDGNRGYQPVLALWAEQDVILADEFRDGNSLPSGLTRWVPAGSGNRRAVEKALAALPGAVDKIYLRGDSALYEHELMRWLDEQAIGYAISAAIGARNRFIGYTGGVCRRDIPRR